MKDADRVFFRNFLVVLAALIVLALIVGIGAGMMSANDQASSGLDPRYAATVEKRIAPIGKVAVGEPPKEQVAVAAAPRAPRSGEEIAGGVCAACHTAGIAGAPKTGDAAAWQTRWAAGVDATVANAINGKGGMPPRGGSDATDDEIRAAVLYMFKQAGFE